jgi:hypothetical protein
MIYFNGTGGLPDHGARHAQVRARGSGGGAA